jgi:hypothetical protein
LPLLSKDLDEDILKEVCEKINGKEINFGDFSFSVKLLPKIDIFVIFWKGDEDFENSLDFLFDETIGKMLSLEDIVVISQMLSKRILYILENEI